MNNEFKAGDEVKINDYSFCYDKKGKHIHRGNLSKKYDIDTLKFKFIKYANYSIPKALKLMLADKNVRNNDFVRDYIIDNIIEGISDIKFDCIVNINDELDVLINSKYLKKVSK